MSEPDRTTRVAPQAPPWEPRRVDPAPAGFHYEWQQAGYQWQVIGDQPRNCQWTTGPGQRRCMRPAVATLDRGSRRGPRLWGYCEEHLYGRTLHDGALWDVVTRPDEQATASGAEARR